MTFCNEAAIASFSAEGTMDKAFKTAGKQAFEGQVFLSSGQWRKLILKTLCIMKLTIFILLLATLQASAIGGHAQKITLSVKDATLEQVFTAIQKQSGYHFFYNTEQVKQAQPVTITIRNVGIQEALKQCLKNQPFTYNIYGNVITLIKKPEIPAKPEIDAIPPIDVKGKVVNESGEPVEGVTVAVKGASNSVVTNANGEFSLTTVDADATLVFTHISMEPFELKVSGKTELLVRLKAKINELDDVTVTVSTGYENIPKERATGSFSKIDNKTLNQQVGTNILQRLEGVTTAVLFDTKPVQGQKRTNITVRGFSSINGPLDPLIVLDGFIYEGDINNINPNLIEDITILKDAAAASIWGARAGNGVIVINTKKGGFNQKLQVDFNSNIIVNSKPDFGYLPVMSSEDYIDVEEFLYHKGVYNNLFTSSSKPAISPAVEIFRAKELAQISAADSASQINLLKNVDIRDEFNKHFYTNAVTQQYNVNFRGGSNTHAYILSVGYDKNLSQVYDKNRRLNIRMENIFRPIKNLEATLGVYYTNSKSESGRPSYGNININSRPIPYLKFADDNGNFLPIAKSIRSVYIDTAGGGKLLDWNYYPLEDYKHDKTTNSLNELYAQIGMRYKLVSFLNIDLKYQYQRQNAESVRLQDIESYEARNRINMFSQLDYATGIVNYIVPKGGIKTQNNGTVESQTLRGQVNLNNTWGKHNISGIFGTEIRNAVRNSNSFTVYGFSADPSTNGIVDFINRYSTFINQSKQQIPGSPEYDPEVNERFVSIYGNIAYTFKNKYILTVSARKDGSNVFGVNTNDRWKPLWSSGIGWNISKEDFYKLDVVPILKFRVTYGYSGNVDVSRSAVPVATYHSSTHSLTNFPFGVIYTLNNPELRWEQIGTLNFGADFSFRNHIVTGSIDYYVKKGKDLYGPSPYDYTTFGLDAVITKNVANMQGNGFEVSLNTKNINKAFKWNTTILFTHQRHKVTKYNSPGAKLISGILSSGDRITPTIGKPLYAIAAFKWGGLNNAGNPQGYLDDELSTDYTAIRDNAVGKGEDGGSIVYVGSAIPTSFGSIINTFSWKNFDLSINLLFKAGYYFKKSNLDYSALISSGSGHKEFESRWEKPGDENITNVPSFVYPNITGRDGFYDFAEIHVLKGDHIRVQFINLSYSIGRNLLGRIPFKQVQLYFNAANLGIIWRANGEKLDPEYPSSIPQLKSWAAGIRASF